MKAFQILIIFFSILLFSCQKKDLEKSTLDPNNQSIPDSVKAIVLASLSTTQNLTVLNPDGSLRWEKQGHFYSDPIYHQGDLYYVGDGGINVVDITNGSLKWAAYGTLVSLPTFNNNILYSTSSGQFLEIDSKNGALLMDPTYVNQVVPIPPLYKDSILYLVSSNSFAYYTLKAFDLKTRNILWEIQTGINPIKSMTISDSTLCIINGVSSFIAINAKTGSIKWQKTDREYSEYIIKDNVVYVTTKDLPREMFAFDIGKGTTNWEWGNPISLFTLERPYLYKGNLYFDVSDIANNKFVVSLDCKTGVEQKRISEENKFSNWKIALVDDKLYKLRWYFNESTRALMVFNPENYKIIDSIPLSNDYVYTDMQIIKSSQQ